MHIHRLVSLPAGCSRHFNVPQTKTNKHPACSYKYFSNEDQLKTASAISENGISHKLKTTTVSMYPKDVYQVYRIRCLA